MGAATASHGERFLAAFNEIEDRFRRELGLDEHAEFAEMARLYADKKHLPRVQRDALLAFASLRNAISHGRFYGGHPIAEPAQAVVTEIEQLRDQITAPPLALAVLRGRDVCRAGPQEPVSAVLAYVSRFDYSQVPVYDDTRYIGMLTTNAIARWLAHQLTLNQGLAEGEPVDRVLAFAEPHERARLVNHKITAAEAIAQLTHGGEGRTPVTADRHADRQANRRTPSCHHQQRLADTVGCTRNWDPVTDLFWHRDRAIAVSAAEPRVR
jgi:hypothetical protein